MRSPTAADLAQTMGLAMTDFADLSPDADERLSSEYIEWVDVIFVMERRQKKRLTALFGAHLGECKFRVLEIPDKFGCMGHALVQLLASRLRAAL